MEEFIKPFVQKLGPTFSSLIGAIALASVLIPYLVKLWETWCDTRSGKRALASERERLELTKLWLEVEALRKEHDLTPPFPIPPPAIPAPATPTQIRFGSLLDKFSAVPGKAGANTGVWRWLAALKRCHRMLSTAALFLLGTWASASACFLAFGLLGAFLTPSRIMEDIGFILFITAGEVLFLLLVRSLHRQYTLLTLSRRVPDLHAQNG